MITKIDIAAPQKSYTVTAELEKYIAKKVGKLDKHMKRQNREGARAEVKLKESTGKGGKKCSCEVILHTPDFKLTAEESTVNMFAAVDIVENKLQKQLKRYKEKHSQSHDKHKNSGARRAFGKFFRKN
jgi:putative sigma-54 modulation protein